MDDSVRGNRKVTRRQLGIFVVAAIVVAILALAYYYSTAAYNGEQLVTVAVRGVMPASRRQALLMGFNGYSETDDGSIALNLIEFPEAGGESETAILRERLMTEIATGSTDLFVLDDYAYGMIEDETILADLGARFPGDPAVVDSRRYALNGTAFFSATALSDAPPMFLALRSSELEAVNKNAHTLGHYAYQSELLENIVKGTPPEDFIVTQAGASGNAYPFSKVGRYFTVLW